MTKLAESESWANGWADQNIFNSRCVGPDCFIPKKKSLLKQVIVSYFFLCIKTFNKERSV